MKTLTLIRHAKSGWKDAGHLDLDRSLNKRGQRDAPMMGKRLAERGAQADLLVSSPAARALTTAEAIAKEIEYPWAEIVVDERLYGADAFQLLDIVQNLDNAFARVMCVGHNPGLTELVNYLSPCWIPDLPTCGIVELTFDTDWWVLVGHIAPTGVNFDHPAKASSSTVE